MPILSANRLVKFLALFCCSGFLLYLIFSPLATTAAFTKQINYQGKLTNASGTAVADTTYSIVFKFYDALSGGTVVWTETDSVTTQSGLFSLMLGANSSLDAINFNQPLYLSINVNGDGEMAPRKVLGTVTSAFEASRLDGNASSTAIDVSSYLTVTGLTNLASTTITNGNIQATNVVSYDDNNWDTFFQTGYGFNTPFFGQTVAGVYGSSTSGTGLAGLGQQIGVYGYGSYGGEFHGLGTGSIGVYADVNDASSYALYSTGGLNYLGGATTINNNLSVNGTTTAYCFTADGINCITGGGITTETDPFYSSASSTLLRYGTSTNALTEGNNNLFYTLARVQDVLVGGYNAIFGNTTTTNATTTGNLNVDGALTANDSMTVGSNLTGVDLSTGDLLADNLKFNVTSAIYSVDNDLTFQDANGGVKTLSQLIAGPGGCSQANSVISGGQATYNGVGLIYDVPATVYCIGGLQYFASAAQVTLETADPGADRIDVIAVNSAGQVIATTGATSTNPIAPAPDPATQLDLTFVYIKAGAVLPGPDGNGPRQEFIYLDNGEWTGTQNFPNGGVISFSSTADPQAGTKNIEVTTPLARAGYFQFATSTAVWDPTGYTYLSFYVKNKTAWTSASDRLNITLRDNSGNQLGSTISIQHDTYGFDKNNTTAYQKITIPLSTFGTLGQAIKYVRFTTAPANQANTFNFRMDGIVAQGPSSGGATPTTGLSGAGLAKQITFWTGTSTMAGSNAFIWDNTNSRLGIGVSSPPATALEVLGTASSTALRVNGTATTTNLAITGLASTYLSVNGLGQVIATTSPTLAETDPVWLAASSSYVAYGASTTNWNTAFNWGNHALAGYLTNLTGGLNAILGDATTTGNLIVGGDLTVTDGKGISLGGTYRTTWPTAGGGSGGSFWATTSVTDSIAYPDLTGQYAVVIGASATSSPGIRFEVSGNSKLSGTLTVTSNTSLTNASTTNLSIGTDAYLTALGSTFLAVDQNHRIIATTSPVLTETDPVWLAASSSYLTLLAWYATTTDALAQGSTNLYWSNALFDTRLNATTSLPLLATIAGVSTIGSSTGQTIILGKNVLTNASTTNLSVATNAYLTALGSTFLAVDQNHMLIATTSPQPAGSYISSALTKGWTLVGNDSGVAQATSSIFITSAGNVGIGTTNPATTKLEVLGTASSTGLQVNGAGTITGALTLNTALSAASGGTGLSAYSVGDLIYANATTPTLARLADVAAGSYLLSGGITTAPLWSTLKLPNTGTAYRLPVFTSTDTMGQLAASGSTGQYLRGNTTAIPSWATLNQAAVAGLTTADSPTFAGLNNTGNTTLGDALADTVTIKAGIELEPSSGWTNWKRYRNTFGTGTASWYLIASVDLSTATYDGLYMKGTIVRSYYLGYSNIDFYVKIDVTGGTVHPYLEYHGSNDATFPNIVALKQTTPTSKVYEVWYYMGANTDDRATFDIYYADLATNVWSFASFGTARTIGSQVNTAPNMDYLFSGNVTAAGTIGVNGYSPSSAFGVYSKGSAAGVLGSDSVDTSIYGALGYAGAYGVYGSGGTYAGYFEGDVYMAGDATTTGTLSVGAGAAAADSFVDFSLANVTKWTMGNDATNNNFVIATGTALGTSNKFSISGTTGAVTVNSLTTNGAVYSNAGVLTNTNPSSEAYKYNISSTTLNTSALLGLQVKSFKWNETGISDFGLIAEEVKNVLPELYSEDNGVKGYRLDHLTFYLLQLAQSQQQKIDLLTQNLASTTASLNNYINNAQTLASATSGWSITSDGTLVVKKIKAEELCLGNTCLDETKLKALLQNNNVPPTIPPTIPPDTATSTPPDTATSSPPASAPSSGEALPAESATTMTPSTPELPPTEEPAPTAPPIPSPTTPAD